MERSITDLRCAAGSALSEELCGGFDRRCRFPFFVPRIGSMTQHLSDGRFPVESEQPFWVTGLFKGVVQRQSGQTLV